MCAVIDAVRRALDEVLDHVQRGADATHRKEPPALGASEHGPRPLAGVRYGVQPVELGVAEPAAWQGGGSPVEIGTGFNVPYDGWVLLHAATVAFDAALDAGAPLRRIDVELHRIPGGWARYAGAESVDDYRELVRSWQPWQAAFAAEIVPAADRTGAEWIHANLYQDRQTFPPNWDDAAPGMKLRTPAMLAAEDPLDAAVPSAVVALLNEVIDAFRRSGRRLVRISVSVLPSGQAGVKWWYELDVSRSPAVSPLPPPARQATAIPRSTSMRTPPTTDPHRSAKPARETPVDRAPRDDPDRHWDRLLAVLTSRLGTAWLQPPASETDLARLTAAFGHPLPTALRAGYLRHNGQADTDMVGRFFGLRWLSIDEILARTAFDPADRSSATGRNGPAPDVELDPDRAGDPAAMEAYDHSSTPPHAVQLRFAHSGWLPVFDRVLSGYSFLAIDMAPGPAGSAGQVINFGEYEHDHVVIARDFHALLAWMDAEATADRLAYHDDDEHDHVSEGCHLVHTDERNVDLITLLADRCGRHSSAR